jgi:hypothetical protein
MPIVGGNTTYLTTTADLTTVVCRPTAASVVLPNATPVKRDLQWSHSEVFVTPFGTSTALERMNVADLTTVFTPLPSCVDRWMLVPPQPCNTDSTSHNVVCPSIPSDRSSLMLRITSARDTVRLRIVPASVLVVKQLQKLLHM